MRRLVDGLGQSGLGRWRAARWLSRAIRFRERSTSSCSAGRRASFRTTGDDDAVFLTIGAPQTGPGDAEFFPD